MEKVEEAVVIVIGVLALLALTAIMVAQQALRDEGSGQFGGGRREEGEEEGEDEHAV